MAELLTVARMMFQVNMSLALFMSLAYLPPSLSYVWQIHHCHGKNLPISLLLAVLPQLINPKYTAGGGGHETGECRGGGGVRGWDPRGGEDRNGGDRHEEPRTQLLGI
jgi:hypothetical protein